MTNVQPEQLDLLADPPPPGSYDGAQLADDNAESGWREAALAEIENMAASGQEFSSDDLRAKIGEPDHPNRWGPLFITARRRGLIEPVFVRPSTIASTHGRLIRVWRGVRS